MVVEQVILYHPLCQVSSFKSCWMSLDRTGPYLPLSFKLVTCFPLCFGYFHGGCPFLAVGYNLRSTSPTLLHGRRLAVAYIHHPKPPSSSTLPVFVFLLGCWRLTSGGWRPVRGGCCSRPCPTPGVVRRPRSARCNEAKRSRVWSPSSQPLKAPCLERAALFIFLSCADQGGCLGFGWVVLGFSSQPESR